jgi:hypothetical protein
VLFICSRIAMADAGAADSAVAPVFPMHVFETVSTNHSFLKPEPPGGTPHEHSGHHEQPIRHHENRDTLISSTNPAIEAAREHQALGQSIPEPLGGKGQASSISAGIILTLHCYNRSILPPVTGGIAHSPEIPAVPCARSRPGTRAVGLSTPSILWRQDGAETAATGSSWVLLKKTRDCRALQVSVN